MRFIGNKEQIIPEISAILAEAGITRTPLVFFDAFCGTGAVSDALKSDYDIRANDIMEWCVTYTRGRLRAASCKFEALGFDPFEHFANDAGLKQGLFYNNYSPGGSSRMYFTPENAARIDYLRCRLEEWRDRKLVSADEYCYLLASLIESTSMVSNTAGVYGAFLKHWDPRALRPFVFAPVKSRPVHARDVRTDNRRIEEIISDVQCDILYLDPPYTQNQYGTQYHLLETLVKYDNPEISRITGSRPTAPMRSDWSKDIKTQILFDRLVAKTTAKYILVSYSADGFMSKSYIESVLKRYGEPGTLITRPISYRKYTNTKSREKGDHVEYLFLVKKAPISKVRYTSPLNYPGSKARMIPFLEQHFPDKITTFIDAFGGSFNVGINSTAEKIIYNDYNHLVSNLISSFREHEPGDYIAYVRRLIAKFGLEKERSEPYVAARHYYNSLPIEKRDPRLLYAVIQYGFNQQIRFNADLDFNNPVGQRWFNERIMEKLISFSRVLREKNVHIKSYDYADLLPDIDRGAFVYMDPPYRFTTGAYNDGKRGFKGWDLAAEKRLLSFAEELNRRGVNFMISYVLDHKGQTNSVLARWIADQKLRIVECLETQGIGRREVIIFNYDKAANSNSPVCDQGQVPERWKIQGYPS